MTLIDAGLATLGERISAKKQNDFLAVDLPLPHRDDQSELVGLYASVEAALAPNPAATATVRPAPGFADDHRAWRGMIVQLVGACRDDAAADLAANLCVTAAKLLGKRVLLLDETNRPFNNTTKQAQGVVQRFVNMSTTGAIIARLAGTEMFFAPLREGISGALPTASIHQFTATLDTLRPLFDLILVRGPSMAGDPFARVMAPHADANILIVEAGRTRARDVAQIQDQLSMSGAAVLGSVMVNQARQLPRWLERLV